ncbi:MAG: metalloprotease RseP [Pseudomonadota bacterium]|jgi:regulator of sigma E protease
MPIFELFYTLLMFTLVLIVLVGVHEYGHFSVARLCGVRVLRFSIGMGKPFLSFYDKQGTEFCLAPIPLGGYVKMLDETEGPISPSERHLSYNQKSPWARMAILAAGPVANLLLAMVLFAFLGMGGIQSLAPEVFEVKPASAASQAGIEPGQEIIAVDGVPTPTQEEVMEQLLRRLGESGEIIFVTRNGRGHEQTHTIHLHEWLQGTHEPDPFENLGFELYRRQALPIVGQVMPKGAAERAGFKALDKLIQINGEPVVSWKQWVESIKQSPNQPLNVRLERDGLLQEVVLTPDGEVHDGKLIGRIGVYPQGAPIPEHLKRTRTFTPVGAVVYGFEKSYSTASLVLLSIKKLLVGEISTKNLSGPIGIAKVAGDSARAGLVYYLGFLAQLSVYLAVLNLLPIPVLDGGHIMYCLLEAAKGSPVSEKLKLYSAQLGLVLLGCVMVVAFYNDILRL